MQYLLFIYVIFISRTVLSAQDYNILDFGAIGDGITLNTTKIQAAIDAAYAHKGGRVIIPAGSFLSGSIVLKSGVELHLLKDAVLLGSTDPEQYIKINRWKALVMADNQVHIAITGQGEIDGQGRALALHIDSLFYVGKIDSVDYMFAERRPKWYLRPQLIEFVNCTNIEVRNVTMLNSACWVQTYDQCSHINMDSIRVISDAYWNNDGVDIQDCYNVSITNSDFNSSDDGICLKSQLPDHSCNSIYISNCTIRSGANALKLGAVSWGGFNNVNISNIRVYDTFRSVIAIECVDGGTLENVKVENVEAVNTGNAIFIRLGDRNETHAQGTLKNVTIKNMKVGIAFGRPDIAYEIRGPELSFFHNTFPASITGIPGHPVENVTLENIEINYPGRGNNGLADMPLSRLENVPEKVSDYPEFSMFGELPAWGFYVRHMDGLNMKNIKLSIDAADYRPALIFDDVSNLDLKSMFIGGDSKPIQIILHKTEKVDMDNMQAVIKM